MAPFPPAQPHQLNRYHESESPHGPYGLDNSSAALSSYDFSNNHSFQSVPRTRLQYPHPVKRPGIHDRPTSSTLNLNNVGEHALRRKTPNGTLAAGYDGTPGDMTIQPPASKHILVSQLESGQLVPPQASFPIDSWQQPTLDQSSSAQPLNFPPMHKTDPARGNAGLDDLAQGFNGISWIRSLNAGPGVDSALNQTLPLPSSQQRFYWHNGAYVPTVLPATLQPCVGPTASATGTGPYGPYWPDGAYIPYRPAALREHRLDPQGLFASSIGHSAPHFFDSGQQPFNICSAPSNNFEFGDWSNNPLHGFNQDNSLKTNFPLRHSDHKPFDFNNQRSLPFHTRQSNPNPGFSSRPSLHEPSASWSGTSASDTFQNTGPVPGSRVVNAEFKEKVLTWAHGVYVDLLASIHRARRNSASNSTQDGQTQRILKPSIYPKPPRQPGLDFSHTSAPEFSRHNSYPSSQYGLMDLCLKYYSNLDRHHRYNRAPSFSQSTNNHLVDRLRHAGRLNSISGSPFSASLSENTAVVNAASSLELLSHLCMESGWEWIDGMLLGGCLAYGLGDYNKAMRWYSRILARDAA